MSGAEATKKEKILNFIRDNKLKSFLIVVGIVIFIVVAFNKKSKANEQEELKQISKLYQGKENTEELYKTKYFKQIDPQLQEQSKTIAKLTKTVEELETKGKKLESQIIETAKNNYGDVLNNSDNYKKTNSMSDILSQAYSNGEEPKIPQLKGQNSPTVAPKLQYVEWDTINDNEESLLLIDDEDKKADEIGKIEEKYRMILPSATLMLVKLDNGMHLSTLSMGNSATTPVTATVTSEAFMPNGRTFDLKGAKMVLEGVGSLSSERGYIKPLRISGFNAQNETFDLPIQGYVSDVRTGIQGIQGEIISKQETLFWSSLIAYTMQGIGKGVASSNQIMTTSAFGTTTTTPPNEILSSSLANGVGEGAKEVGNAILDIAKNIEPIVEILGDQYAIVHTTMPFVLEYRIDGDSNYDKEIKVAKNETETTKKVDEIVKGMKK